MTRCANNSKDGAAGQSPRRWRGLAAIAGFAVVGLAATAVASAVSTSASSEPVGELATSMVEMLAGENSSGVTTLSELRNDVLGSSTYGDGSGIDVALIDTGVAPVDGLDGDKVLHGPDLSFEGQNAEVAYLDTYGHGTHMAGIIAGDRAGAPGIAPGARIVSLKVAGHDGLTTVPQVWSGATWSGATWSGATWSGQGWS